MLSWSTHPLPRRLPLMPSKYSMTVMIFIVMLSLYYFSRHVSICTRSSLLLLATLSGPPEQQSQNS